MASDTSLRVHFQDVAHSARVRTECEDAAKALRDEFPEADTFEVRISHTGDQHETHVHVVGKELDVASHALADGMAESLHDALDKARRQLRKHHDKVIFGRRRDAQKNRHES